MTRYEVYLNTYYALQAYSMNHPKEKDLTRLVEDMNPYCFNSEGSRDPYIYDRFEAIWLREGTMYTFNTENSGFSFAKVFFKSLPKSDVRFQIGLRTIQSISEDEWAAANYWQVISGTYQLLYYMLNNLKDKDKQLSDFLKGMDPFHTDGSTYSVDPEIGNDYFAFCQKSNPRELSYDLADAYIDHLNKPFLTAAFRKIKEKVWETIRCEKPYVFRFIIEN